MKNYISSLNLTAFKGQTRQHTFNPGVTCCIGRNGAGKSTIHEAISFTLAGRIPGYGKLPSAMMRSAPRSAWAHP